MKPYAIIFTFICMSSLFALTAPANVRVAAIDQDAFTLRWNAVEDAEQYELDVQQAIATQMLENFDTNSTYPTGWSSSNVYVNTGYPALAPQSGSFISLKYSSSSLITPLLSNPQTIEFWAYRSTGVKATMTLTIQYATDVDSQDWISIGALHASDAGGEITTAKKMFTFQPYLFGDYHLKFRLSSTTSTNLYLDGITVNCISAQAIDDFSSLPASYNATRITNLDPSTNYLHRVRATTNSEQSAYSPWQITRTLAESSPSSTGSAINNTPASITLLQIGSYPQQSMEIDPDLSDGDYAIEVEQPAANTISYSITAANDELPGSYTISHPGYTASNLQVLGAEHGDYLLSDGSSTIDITSFTGKGAMQIVLSMDETLPVEMGTMTLTHVGPHSLNLQWFSYSESNLLGYYVQRSAVNDLRQAGRVSELIPAENSSTNTQYVFRDTDVEQSYYYWLEAMDYSGNQSYYGPEYYQMPAPGHAPPAVLRNALQNIYPNPFNPSTTISYSLKEHSPVHLSIYDTRGSLIHRHHESGQEAGLHSYIWNAENAASGVYFIRMQIGESCFERKLVLMK